MAILKWNNIENCWECSDCGARFSREEVARMFDYQATQTRDKFTEGYCMDCGNYFIDCEA